MRLHAGHTWLACGTFSSCEELGLGEALPVLGGVPVACADVRAVAAARHDMRDVRERRVLLVDNSVPGSWGCAACVLGADVVWGRVGEGLVAVSLSRFFLKHGAEGSGRLREHLDARCMSGGERLEDATCDDGRSWRAASDEAQVVASFLACHPDVTELRYPGLTTDPSFEVAARTLQGGFGPLLDYRLAGEDRWHRVRCDGGDPRERILSLEAELGH